MPPSKVNFKAFESRLSTTLAHRSRSTYTGLGQRRAVDDERRGRAARPRCRTCWPARGCTAARSTGSKRASTRPDSSREKSSRVLTSLSSRWPLRRITSTRSRCRPVSGSSSSLSGVLGRPEQQGQRGAELVADVGEEVGLRLVELGQRLGAGLLELVGARVGDAGGQLAGDQAAEVAVAVVEGPVAVERRTPGSRTAPPRCSARAARRAPRAGGTSHAPVGRSGNARVEVARRARCARPSPRPPATPTPVSDSDSSAGRGGMLALEAGAGPTAGRWRRPRRTGRPARTAGPGRWPASSRQAVATVSASDSFEPRRAPRSRSVCMRRCATTSSVSSLDHAQQPGDGSVVVEERAVGEGVVGLLGVAAALAGTAAATRPTSRRPSSVTASTRGVRSSQISAHTSDAGRPSAQGYFSPRVSRR